MPAGRLGATTYLVPVLVVALSWVFLDEAPRPLALLGGLLCPAGVAISRRDAAAPAPVPDTVPVTAQP